MSNFRKLLGFCLVLGVGVVLGRIFDGAPQRAEAGGGGEKCAAQNGDINADGKVDLSDAVTILGNLFLGSPTELVGLCVPPPSPSGLPDTGQAKCHNQAGGEIPCDSATCPGQDGRYATGCPSEGRFTDNGDGTVTDQCTGLMWQQDTADVSGDGLRNASDRRNWCGALSYCGSLTFAGHDDWRLPNVRELQSIVDYGSDEPAIDPVFAAISEAHWSSTSLALGGRLFPWFVGFKYGTVDAGDVDGSGLAYVRAVRTGP